MNFLNTVCAEQNFNKRPAKVFYIAFMIFVWPFFLFAQGREVTFIKAVPKMSPHNTKDSVIAFPIFSFKNKTLSDKINRVVKADLYESYDLNKSLPIKNVLRSLAKEGLAELSYEEVRNDTKFFSFVLHHEWIAAYPTYHQSYFAFDKQSTKFLTLDSLILPEKRKAFQDLIFGLWRDSITRYKKELFTQLIGKELDSTDYTTALEYTGDHCLPSFSPKNFKLSKDGLEVFFTCPFPRIMRPLDPSGGLSIPFHTIREYLRPRYRPWRA